MERRFTVTLWDDEELKLGQEVFLGVSFIVTETGMETIDVTGIGDRSRKFIPGRKYAVLHATEIER